LKVRQLDQGLLAFFRDYGELDRVISYCFHVFESGSFDFLEG
jgi:hypothetical protein